MKKILLGSVNDTDKRKLLDAIYLLDNMRDSIIEVTQLGIKDMEVRKDVVSLFKKLNQVTAKVVNKYKG